MLIGLKICSSAFLIWRIFARVVNASGQRWFLVWQSTFPSASKIALSTTSLKRWKHRSLIHTYRESLTYVLHFFIRRHSFTSLLNWSQILNTRHKNDLYSTSRNGRVSPCQYRQKQKSYRNFPPASILAWKGQRVKIKKINIFGQKWPISNFFFAFST